MPNEVDDIVQNIVLTGNDEVAAAFGKIQDAGENAFQAISRAIDKSVFSFTGLVTAVAGITAATAAIGVGMFEFVKSTEEGVSALSDLADQTGTTTEEMSGLTAAFASGGVGASELQFAFKRLSVSIQQSWTEIKKATLESTDQLKGDALSVQSALLAVSDAQQKLNNLNRDQALQRRQDNNSVASAQQRIDELNAKSQRNAGIDTSALDRQLASQKEMLELQQAQLAVAEARKKRADDLANAEKEQKRAEIAAEQAAIALNQARRKEQEDQKNDINNVTNAVKKIAEGDADAINTINASAENIAKGIIKSTADGEKAIGELKSSITDLGASGAPGVKETFLQIGRVLQNVEDPALKTAVAFRLLGRSVSQEFLNVLSDPEKIESFIKRINDLGLAIDAVDNKVSGDFRAALFTLQNDIQLVSVKLATAFGPGFTTILKAIDEALLANKQSFITFAETISSRAVPVVESFIRVLSGVPDAASDQWLVDYVNKIKAFGAGIGQLVDLVATVFGAIISGAGKVAEALNSVFGTNLNAFDVLFAAWVIRITTGFAAIQAAAVEAATGVAIGMAPVLVTLGTIVAGVYAVVKAWEALKDILGVGKTSHLDAILDGTMERLRAIGEILTGNIKKGFEDWEAANKKQAEAEKSLDDIDKQVADGKKHRQEELAKAERDALKESLDEDKKAADEKDDTSRKSADNQIASNKRVADSGRKAIQDSKRDASDLQKLQEAHPDLTIARGQPVKSQGPPGRVIDVAQQLAEMNRVLNEKGTFGPFRRPLPSQIEKPEVPPQTAVAEEDVKKFEDAVEHGVESGLDNNRRRSTQDLPDISSPIPSGPETVPFPQLPLPDRPPLSPDLQQRTGLQDLKDAFAGLPGLFTSLKDGLSSFFNTIRENINNLNKPPTPDPLAATSSDFLNSLLEKLNSLFAKQGDNKVTDPAAGAGIRGDIEEFDKTIQEADSSTGSLASSFDQLASAAQSAAEGLSGVGGGGNAIEAAGGGWIRGAGTETSDSILARLSHNEFVQPAAATNFYGVNFMEAVRGLRFPRFNVGGLVGLLSPSLPRFATGGVVRGDGGGAMQHLGSVDLSTNHGVIRVAVTRDGLSELRRASVMRNMGADKKPGWVR